MKLSVIIPALNEEANIPVLTARLRSMLDGLGGVESSEVILVDDHSSDGTSAAVRRVRAEDARFKLLRLSRNSGSHVALQAGLIHATGDVAVTMSADLQDPPEMIPEMLDKIRAGAQIVWAVRASRAEGLRRRVQGSLYHRVFRLMLPAYPAKGTDHFMVAGEALEVIRRSPEKNTSLMGLVCWMGFRQDQVFFHRAERAQGESKWTFGKTFKLIVDSMLSFSYWPIRAMSLFGVIMATVGFLYIVALVFRYLVFGSHGAEGWHSLMVAVVFLGGIQMTMLGVLGEYLWRVFEEVRRRPLFIVEAKDGL